MPRTKTSLERLLTDIFEPEDADPSVLETALRESGVDVDAERVRYEAAVAAAVNRLRRSRLDQGRSQRLSQGARRAQALQRVRAHGYSTAELVRRITRAPGHQVAHREFEKATQEDLESQLADLLLLMDDDSLLDDP